MQFDITVNLVQFKANKILIPLFEWNASTGGLSASVCNITAHSALGSKVFGTGVEWRDSQSFLKIIHISSFPVRF